MANWRAEIVMRAAWVTKWNLIYQLVSAQIALMVCAMANQAWVRQVAWVVAG